MATAEKLARVKEHTVYRLQDGTRVPSATTVLGVLAKDGLVPWAWNLGRQGIDWREYRDELADAGTLAHYMILCHLTRRRRDPAYMASFTDEQKKLARNSYRKFLAWKKQHRLDPILLEQPLVSERYRFGGTPDYFGGVDRVPTIVDFKTSKAVYDSHLFQAASYRQLVRELGHEADAVRILQIGRTEDEGFTERVVSGPELDLYWEIFYHALQIYWAKKRLERGA